MIELVLVEVLYFLGGAWIAAAGEPAGSPLGAWPMFRAGLGFAGLGAAFLAARALLWGGPWA